MRDLRCVAPLVAPHKMLNIENFQFIGVFVVVRIFSSFRWRTFSVRKNENEWKFRSCAMHMSEQYTDVIAHTTNARNIIAFLQTQQTKIHTRHTHTRRYKMRLNLNRDDTKIVRKIKCYLNWIELDMPPRAHRMIQTLHFVLDFSNQQDIMS